jgi:hypothetical protein
MDGLLRAAEFLTSIFKVSTADTFVVVRKSFHLVLTTIIADLERIASIRSGAQNHRLAHR